VSSAFRALVILVCAAIGGGVSVLWARSATLSAVIVGRSSAGHMRAIAVHRGGVVVFVSEIPLQSDRARYLNAAMPHPNDLDAVMESVFDQPSIVRSRWGFILAKGTFTTIDGSFGYHAVRIPNWPIVLVAVLMMLLLTRGPLRRYRWKRQGKCMRCGYDLRGNPSDRCPECGAAVTSPAASQSPPAAASAPASPRLGG
jgi:hypothetical protein